jgi:integrase
VVFPDVEHEASCGFLRELAASDCSPATLRSYAFDLLRGLRFLDDRSVDWRRAERVDVRELVEVLRETPNPQRLRRRAGAPAPGSVNASTGKPELGSSYAPRTINHQLSVLAGFYDWAIIAGLGPLVNPVPPQHARGRRVHAHHSPAEDFVVRQRARYRQKVPFEGWHGMPDEAADRLFGVLRCDRDRALLAFWLTSGVRASELLGLRHGDVDVGRGTITVVSKGTRLRQAVPASVDAFVWLALYLAEDPPPPQQPAGPVWWTRQGPPERRRPLTYHGARAVLERANAAPGTNWTLHDLRHTAAARLIADPGFSLVDVQTVLRHAQVATTQLYVQPRLDEVVAKVVQHYAQPPAPPTLAPGYDLDEVGELLGMQVRMRVEAQA